MEARKEKTLFSAALLSVVLLLIADTVGAQVRLVDYEEAKMARADTVESLRQRRTDSPGARYIPRINGETAEAIRSGRIRLTALPTDQHRGLEEIRQQRIDTAIVDTALQRRYYQFPKARSNRRQNQWQKPETEN